MRAFAIRPQVYGRQSQSLHSSKRQTIRARTEGSLVPDRHIAHPDRRFNARVKPQVAHITDKWEILLHTQMMLWVAFGNFTHDFMQLTARLCDMRNERRRKIQHDRRASSPAQRPEVAHQMQAA